MIPLFIKAFWRSLTQFFTPPILKTFLLSLFATIGIFITVLVSLHYGIRAIITLTTEIPWLTYLSIIGDFGGVALAFFAFPAVLIAVSSLFLEPVILAVEKKYYPNLVPVKPKFKDEIWLAIKFFFVVLGVNLLALPLYLIPVINGFVFLLVNSFLISREYYELIAIRHIPKKELKTFNQK